MQDIVQNNLFGIVIEPEQAVCEIELRNAQDKTLHKYDVRVSEAVMDPSVRDWAKEECQ
jgi:hypothetical protein